MSGEKKFIDRKLPGESQSEKIEYRGKFRIIGQIVDTRNNNKLIGYLLLNEQTYTFKAFSISQIKTLLGKFKFVNAELKNGIIVNTEKATHGDKISENSFDKLPSYNSRLGLISGEKKFMVLGRVIENTSVTDDDDGIEVTKFRVLDANLHIVELDENQLAIYSNKGFTCVNGKFVNRQVKIKDSKTKGAQVVDKCIVSSLKGEFPVISKDKVKQTVDDIKKKSTDIDNKDNGLDDDFEKTDDEKKAEEYRHQMHINKLIKASPKMISYGMGLAYGDIGYKRRDGQEGFRYRPVHYRNAEKKWYFKQDARIEAQEIFSKHIKDAKNKELLKKHWENLKNENKMTNETYYGIAQFFLYLPNVYEEALNYAKKYPRKIQYYLVDQKKSTPYSELKKKNLLCNRYLELEKELIQYAEEKYGKKKSKPEGRALRVLDDNVLNFKKSSEIAELGFCISEKNDGYKYTTKDGHYFTLKYIGKDIENYDKYYNLATSFGDLYTIKVMEICLKALKSNDYYRIKVILNYLEIFSVLLSIYNPKLYKVYLKRIREEFKSAVEISNSKDLFLKDRIKEDLKFVYAHLKNLDTGKDVDYKLDSKIDIYYKSGYTSFYSDIKTDLVDGKEKVINYRAKYGTKFNIKHPLLQSELVPILSVLTSERIETKSIEKEIGRLHWVNSKAFNRYWH